MLTGVVVFALTYVLIAARRLRFVKLDRPADAMLGAVLCVALGVLTPQQALAAIDGRTLVLLFGLMGVGAFLAEGGQLERLGSTMTDRARTPQRLLGMLVWGAGLLSALVTNDAVCVLGAPVVVHWIERHRLPPLPFLLALATGANTGSVATLVGNPQNMLCATFGGLEYRSYLLHLAPVAVAGLALNHLLLWLMFRRRLGDAPLALPPAAAPAQSVTWRGRITFAVLGGTVLAYLLGTDLAWTAVAGLVLLLVVQHVEPREIWYRIDWAVLVFFAGLFVVVDGLVRSGAVEHALAALPLWPAGAAAAPVLGWWRAAAYFLFGSNVVSNVPFILVVRPYMQALPNPVLAWELLAMASTFAGNLTLLGSVANIIVAERGRRVGGLPFWAYLRVGFPLAVGSTAIGTAWLLLVHGAFTR